MSKLVRALVVEARLAAMNLAGMTAIAQAQSNEEPISTDAQRSLTQGQVEERTTRWWMHE
jgi:hypothetical protein